MARHRLRTDVLRLSVLLICCFFDTASADLAPPRPRFQEAERDALGVWQSSPNYARMAAEGLVVVHARTSAGFFAVWVPQNYATRPVKRVMLAVHGDKGNAYAEMRDELELAKKYGYALVGIQWRIPGAPDDVYLNPQQMYGLIDQALIYMNQRHGADVRKAAYVGFSRGSAQSFEVAYWDRAMATHHFALVIGHSGFIPENQPTPFWRDVLTGKLGTQPFAGARFYLYCGEKDEEWGAQQCQNMDHTLNVLKKNGAVIERAIRDPNGTHGGYRRTAEYHEAAVKRFLELTR